MDRSAESPGRWSFDQVEIDERQRELRVGGQAVAIESKPFEVLLVLLARAGETVTKEELINEVWPGRVVTDGVLTKAVLKLRVAIGDTEQALVRTVHGYGYRLVAPVTALEADAATMPHIAEIQNGAGVPLRPNWRFIRRLGRGGFGEVWLAEQAKTHEPRVFKFASNGAQLAALKREITISRLLHESLGARADIVRVLDWNLDDPPHFIETEYADGGSLDNWFSRNTDLSVAARIEMVARIADALAAAHSVGVLHKDLKPANILVLSDNGGVPGVRLADFGSGVVLDNAQLEQFRITRLGFTVVADSDSTSGTPYYLAPERLAGQAASIHGDIFALGILLYQFLLGDFRRPLAPGWERQINDELLREDIAAAAEQDPSRRLGDAAELARRLRGLDARRLERDRERAAAARSARLAQQVERAGIRRRWQFVALVTLLAGIVASSIMAWRELGARHDAERNLAAQEAVLRFVREDLLAKADPFQGDGSAPTVRSVLQLAHERAQQSLADQPEVAVAVLSTISAALGGLGEHEAAERDAEASLAIARKHLPIDHRTRLEAERVRADLDEVQGNWQRARAAYLDLQPRFERVFGVAHVSTRMIAHQLAWTRFLSGDFAQAATEFCTLAEDNSRLLGADHDQTAMALSGCGLALCRAGRCAEAIAPTERSIALRTQRYGENSPALAQTLFSLELAQIGAGNAVAALATIDRILAILQRHHLADTHPQFTLARHERAAVLLRLDRPHEALADAETAISTRTTAFGASHAYVAASRNLRARAYAALGRRDEALAEFDAALKIAEADGKDSELATRIRGFRDKVANAP